MISYQRVLFALVAAVAIGTGSVSAQDGPFKADRSDGAPPGALAAPIKDELETSSVRILDGQGKPLARIWLRKHVPAASKPAGPKEAILYPFLGEGELLGAIEFAAEGHDYRDQSIAPGVYTLRYGLQPVNGDHLGVSTYRDYALLLPAANDKALEMVPKKLLEKQSAAAAASNHPAVFLLTTAPAGAKAEPAMVHDETKNLWGVVLPLGLSVKGESGSSPAVVQMIIVGAAMT
jgi:hypothetical protein